MRIAIAATAAALLAAACGPLASPWPPSPLDFGLLGLDESSVASSPYIRFTVFVRGPLSIYQRTEVYLNGRLVRSDISSRIDVELTLPPQTSTIGIAVYDTRGGRTVRTYTISYMGF
jgi:hypothetical protein